MWDIIIMPKNENLKEKRKQNIGFSHMVACEGDPLMEQWPGFPIFTDSSLSVGYGLPDTSIPTMYQPTTYHGSESV